MSRIRPSLAALALAAAPLLAACSSNGPQGPGEVPGVAGGTNDARHLSAPYVVMVSFDGFRHDYIDRLQPPNLLHLAREGVRAERMIPVFPSKTFPSHYTLATGMYAESHGLVGNRFWDPDREATYEIGDRSKVEDGSWYRGEPLWVTAETQGMVAASYFWVGSEADVQSVRPSYWHPYDGRVAKEERVDQVLAWLTLPPESRPHMITLYFSDVDGAGHDYGPDSPEVAAAVADVDRALGRLVDGIDALPHGDSVYVVVVSDHGMLRAEADRVEVFDPALFPGVRMVTGGPYASFFIDEGGPERHPRVRDSLRALMPTADVWLRDEVPGRFHYSADPRIGDLVALAPAGAQVVEEGRVPRRDGFTHGWDNRVEEMGAIFVARGPGIAAGQRLDPFEAVHVYPFVTYLLGLTPNPDADGRLEVLAGVHSPEKP